MAEILAAEDSRHVRDTLRRALESGGHSVRLAKDGNEALAAFAEKRPDLVLLDVMMPGKNGYEVCAHIRRTDPSVPVIILTAKDAEGDKIVGFGLGADDYVTKPFGVGELLARISAVLRRCRPAQTPSAAGPGGGSDDGVFSVRGCRVDSKKMTVSTLDGRMSSISARELGLLKTFADHPEEVLSRDKLLSDLWGVNYYGTTRTLDQHIMNLRKKMGSSGAAIETVTGIGYRFRP